MTTPDSSPPPRKKHSRLRLWLLLAAGCAAGLYLAQTRKIHAQAPRAGGRGGAPAAAPVAAAVSRLGNMPVYFDGLGSVTPFYTVTVRTRVDGQLMNVYFREGQYVREGEVLAEIDPRPFQVQLEQAEGQMARDQATLANAHLDLNRYRTLLEQDAIPKQQLDTQVATVGQLDGALKTDQAAIDNAKLQLTYCRIIAPISGRIGLRLVDPGNMVHATDTNGLLVITEMQPITVVFTLPEGDVAAVLQKLRAGATLPVDAYNRDRSEKLAAGNLLTTDNEIDQSTGTFKLKAVFDNRRERLFPNQFVNVRLLVEVQRRQVLVPSVAIQRGSQGTFVYVIKPDQTVEVRPVTVNLVEGNDTSVTKGVRAGERLVTEGADRLQPGSKVRVTQNAAPPPAGMAGPGDNTVGSPTE